MKYFGCHFRFTSFRRAPGCAVPVALLGMLAFNSPCVNTLHNPVSKSIQLCYGGGEGESFSRTFFSLISSECEGASHPSTHLRYEWVEGRHRD